MSEADAAPALEPDRGGARAIRWAALGDSFTAGLDAAERTWTRIVADRLSAGRTVELENLARIGARVAEIEGEQLPLALACEPTLVTVVGGGNDVIRSVRPDLRSLRADLDRLYRRLRSTLPDALVLTATYPPVRSVALRPRTRRRIDLGLSGVNAIVRELAGRYGARCVELADLDEGADPSNYAEDGIHPSPEGNAIAATVLGAAIEELVNTIEEEAR